jgi:hypothetical protein
MKTFARLTAILLIFFGVLIALGGGYFVARGLTQTEPFLPGLFGETGEAGLLFPMRLLLGGGLFLQGLMLAAAGEALWLITGIARRSEDGDQHLATLAARGSMTIP